MTAATESPREAIVRESVDRASLAARVWASKLGRKPSRREIAAFLAGHLAAEGVTS